MKRLASLVAFALLVPLSASASPSAHTRSSRHPAAKAEPAHAAAPKPASRPGNTAAKPRHARAQTRGHADLGHHEPSVTRGVLVTKVSTRHVERSSSDADHADRRGAAHPAHGAKRDDKRSEHVERGAKKPLPLLPAAALQRVDARELGEGAAKAAPRPGHDRHDRRGAKPEDKASKAAPKLAAPAKEGAKEGGCPKTAAERQPKAAARECLHDPVELVRGAELDRFALQRCEGGLAPLALERLSVALRPSQVARPVLDLRSTPRPGSLSKKAKSAHEVAKAGKAEAEKDVLPPHIKRVDPGLAERLDLIATHFQKPGRPVRVSVVSGYRPASAGSQHAHGRAMDIRVEGVENEELVAFCKSIPDTGCGYYPNSSFVHVDVRDPGAGHVSWIDASGPGEAPRYVTEWPLKGAKPASEPPAVTGGDEHPATTPPDEVAKEPASSDKPEAPKGAKPQELLDGVRD